jgi:hypothetical protein
LIKNFDLAKASLPFPAAPTYPVGAPVGSTCCSPAGACPHRARVAAAASHPTVHATAAATAVKPAATASVSAVLATASTAAVIIAGISVVSVAAAASHAESSAKALAPSISSVHAAPVATTAGTAAAIAASEASITVASASAAEISAIAGHTESFLVELLLRPPVVPHDLPRIKINKHYVRLLKLTLNQIFTLPLNYCFQALKNQPIAIIRASVTVCLKQN